MIPPTLSNEGMRYWRLLPDARLRAWVHCYWWVEPTKAERAEAASLPDLLLPDGHSELVFRFAGEFTRWPLGAAARARMNRSYLIGGRSRSVLTQSPGGLRLAGVKLDPRALRSLLGVPLNEFCNTTVPFSELRNRALLDLEDEVANLRDAGGLAEVLDRFFLRNLREDLQDDATVDHFVETLRATHGGQPVLEWARTHAVNLRTLERRFLARMGMTPKQFARVERFKHSYQRWKSLADAPSSTRAHLEGYYDESHFDREFRYFTGTSPFMRLREAVRFTTTIADHLL
ncbi:MAG TPA: helix-turn-helix domain-containing protein [Steroidobacteraceae bacterium]